MVLEGWVGHMAWRREVHHSHNVFKFYTNQVDIYNLIMGVFHVHNVFKLQP